MMIGKALEQTTILQTELALARSPSSSIMLALEESDLAPLVEAVLDDPIAMKKLGDRVFELLQQDLRRQQERSRGYHKWSI
ncbi:hypothetical protein [cf. Phormidesmis sp. LEGE 11477]|uniref:hypothetical protein n=1 Tax=cf. Phormidesmis sp. LEGE 11477 TaxID=1828680 RepID=UPI00187F40E8|nr:hypothetical protein [cf. Phormidesmis sp. LEGE 11477]MBE9062421.1 hypothetical protein [cf. Phormidesmis sp. LEGE 11477]